jgi:hypothetical protein
MNSAQPSLTLASQNILDNFAPADPIAVLVLNRPLGEAEANAVEDGVNAFEKLLAQLTDVPTPANPSPRQLQSGLVQIEPTKERRE